LSIKSKFPSSLNPEALLKMIDHLTLSGDKKHVMVISVIQV